MLAQSPTGYHVSPMTESPATTIGLIARPTAATASHRGSHA